ncbi:MULTISPECIES: SSI family serine proteinase inhibitor [unclassified Streptomyces]|uniref:SSI family serine proteinase inhibitor n=1 Tax=unclassified Streptomyces TaxID=2593676 RepID=UPI003369F096
MPLLHRLAVAVVTAAASATAMSATAWAAPVPLPLPHDEGSADHLIVTVSRSGGATDSVTYSLECHPAGGTHPTAQEACDQLDSATVWGRNPFAPVPPGAMCTGQYGGPATAQLRGHWAGRPVDARFSRINGCEIARWDRFSAVLRLPGS